MLPFSPAAVMTKINILLLLIDAALMHLIRARPAAAAAASSPVLGAALAPPESPHQPKEVSKHLPGSFSEISRFLLAVAGSRRAVAAASFWPGAEPAA